MQKPGAAISGKEKTDRFYDAFSNWKLRIKVSKNRSWGRGRAKKNPAPGLGLKKIGDDILSHKNCSTICASGLNDSVRKGKR